MDSLLVGILTHRRISSGHCTREVHPEEQIISHPKSRDEIVVKITQNVHPRNALYTAVYNVHICESCEINLQCVQYAL